MTTAETKTLKFDKPTLVTLTAPTCSGKSFLLELLTDHDTPYSKKHKSVRGLCERIVSTTTRKAREGELEGKDYFFITEEQSIELEKQDAFAELITFRGTRYGVTKVEMERKMNGDRPPIVILEPQGLAVYEKYCKDHGWDIFKVYVTTPEPERIKRLNFRTSIDVRNAVVKAYENPSEHTDHKGPLHWNDMCTVTEKLIDVHTDRLLSITGDERRWQSMHVWDMIADGTDSVRAIKDIIQGSVCRNRKNAPPKPYNPNDLLNDHWF